MKKVHPGSVFLLRIKGGWNVIIRKQRQAGGLIQDSQGFSKNREVYGVVPARGN